MIYWIWAADFFFPFSEGRRNRNCHWSYMLWYLQWPRKWKQCWYLCNNQGLLLSQQPLFVRKGHPIFILMQVSHFIELCLRAAKNTWGTIYNLILALTPAPRAILFPRRQVSSVLYNFNPFLLYITISVVGCFYLLTRLCISFQVTLVGCLISFFVSLISMVTEVLSTKITPLKEKVEIIEGGDAMEEWHT